LRWAYKNSLDVLFIQEHNGDRAKVSEWKALCERSGYSIVHGIHNDTTGSGRGAAARIVKMSTFNLTEKDSETQPSQGGRIAHKKVLWKDMILNLVSIYVPVNADEKKNFP
jgi:exonuclease III